MKTLKEIFKEIIYFIIPSIFVVILMAGLIMFMVYTVMIVPESKPVELDLNICDNYANADRVEIKYLQGEKYYYFLGKNYTEEQLLRDCTQTKNKKWKQ